MDSDDAARRGFEEIDEDQIPATDITFECPHCSKSLSIDYRGAGLVIACTACHQPVTVPIPEGMDIADLDADSEVTRAQVLTLRRELDEARKRVAALEEENARLLRQQSASEVSRARTAAKLAELRTLSERILRSHMELSGSVSKVVDVLTDGE